MPLIIFDNKYLLSQLPYSNFLPSITVADDSKIKVQGIGPAHPLPNFSLDFVLYIIYCPFNLIFVNKLTRTLYCSVLFNNNYVYVHDRRIRRKIEAEAEFGGLYHLSPQAACASIAYQDLTH